MISFICFRWEKNQECNVGGSEKNISEKQQLSTYFLKKLVEATTKTHLDMS